jgi:hypothetical protein
MKRHYITIVTAVAVWSALLTGASAVAQTQIAGGARAAGSGGTWGAVKKVPGLPALNSGGGADVEVVSCPSAGNCAASGYYLGASNQEVFVVSEKNGTWGKAEELPGIAALNQGGVDVSSVSCASPGNCSVGGFYGGASGSLQAFIADETNGTWGQAQEVPGTAALNQGGVAGIESVSCPSAGDCSAGGYYTDSSGGSQAFVVSQAHGTWGTADEVPGTAALNVGGLADVRTVSCTSPGNCSAGGGYGDVAGKYHLQVFVASETDGTWGTAEEVPGTAALNTGGDAALFSLSCASAGNCAAGGLYADSSENSLPFVVNETNGRWGAAEEVPGTAARFQASYAATESVSCPSAGNCTAVGQYSGTKLSERAFVVRETHGRWGTAEEVPGTAALDTAGDAEAVSVSCPSAGNCGMGGWYTGASGQEAFVVSEADGRWGAAEEVPGSGALNKAGFAAIDSVSCATKNHCSAGGYYNYGPARATTQQGFAVGES